MGINLLDFVKNQLSGELVAKTASLVGEKNSDTQKALEILGHKFAEKPTNIASATGIMIDEQGIRLGAIDSRSDGEAVGY